MNKRQAENYARTVGRLMEYGISHDDVEALFRIERTLSRWSEQECGDERGRAIERDDKTGKTYMSFESGNGKRAYYAVPDREGGALRRLEAIMRRYPALRYYHQGDPRGCSLYILRTSDIRPLEAIDHVYNRGVAVCI